MKKKSFVIIALLALLTACTGEISPTGQAGKSPATTSSAVTTSAGSEAANNSVNKTAALVSPVSVSSATLTPVSTPALKLFPASFSQASVYNSSGPVPQGGQGNVLVYPTGAKTLASMPAITSDGQLLVLSTGNQGVQALQLDQDFQKIREVWRYTPPEAALKDGFVATPLLYDGLAIVADTSGGLHAVRLSDGKPAWVSREPLRISIAAMPVTDGQNLYFTARSNEDPGMFGPSGGYLYALKLQDGSPVWKSQKISGANGKIIFGFNGNLYFGGWDARLYAYTRGGQPVAGWSDPQVGPVASGPQTITNFTFEGDRIYVGNGGIFALDRSGKLIDSVGFNGIGTYFAPAVAGDTVYAGTTSARPPIFRQMFGIKAFNATNLKEERFTFQTDFPGVANLTVVDGYIYFGAEERFFQVKSDGSGQNRQLFLALAAFSYGNTPLVANGRVYVTNPDGNFYIIR